jgi:hypothetical protein
MKLRLPEELIQIAEKQRGPSAAAIERSMRPASECTTPASLNAQKATRLSFSQLLARRMIAERWTLTKQHVELDRDGRGHLIYEIDFGKYQSTYLAQSFPASGSENYGRRTGLKRDILSSLFAGRVSAERIKEEIRVLGTRDSTTVRSKSDCLGWNPGSRSARVFDDIVTCLAQGRQPTREIIQKSGYIIRNGGFVGSGRFGSISYHGIAADHPLKHPYFPDLFGVLLLRQVGIDLVNGIAAARSAEAVPLSEDLADFFGVGNASGQGMCVALQRWPQWFSTWVLVREFCLARAKLMPASVGSKEHRQLLNLLERAVMYYDFMVPDTEEFTVPHKRIAESLRTIITWVAREPVASNWASLASRVTLTFDAETAEIFNALLIEIYPEFADEVAGYIPIGMSLERDYSPEMSVARFRKEFLSQYEWELRQDLTHSDARRHFWYHSIESGEQRRGERVIDPHEHFESFIDHIGYIQRLASTLTAYDDATPMGRVILDYPELAFTASRVESLAHRPYKEIHGNLLHKDFSPSHLIRFLLSVLGLEATHPMSIRWVPGVLFQGLPGWQKITSGARGDWKFSGVNALRGAA